VSHATTLESSPLARHEREFPTPRLDVLRRTLAEQLAPLVELHERIARRLTPPVNVEGARERIRAGRVALDPRVVLACATDPERAFLEATTALEDAGLVTNAGAAGARAKAHSAYVLLNSWASGELRSLDDATATARYAASLVGRAVLRHAAEVVRRGTPLMRGWAHPHCPCCGGAPDLALLGGDGSRTLACVRCDTMWETDVAGCLGCREEEAPAVVRIEVWPELEYRMVVCSPCARYIKEGPAAPAGSSLLVERAILVSMDQAAKRRGLRF
jgi:hypothetical protein